MTGSVVAAVDPHTQNVLQRARDLADSSRADPDQMLNALCALAALLDDPCPDGMVLDYLDRLQIPDGRAILNAAVSGGIVVDVDPSPADVYVFFSEVLRHALKNSLPGAELARFEGAKREVSGAWNAMTDPGALVAAARTYAGLGDATSAVRAARAAATTFARLHGPLAGARLLNAVFDDLGDSDEPSHLVARGRLALHQARLCREGGDLDAAARHTRASLRLAAAGGGEELRHDATLLWRELIPDDDGSLFVQCARVGRSAGYPEVARRFLLNAAEMALAKSDDATARDLLQQECDRAGIPGSYEPRDMITRLRLA